MSYELRRCLSFKNRDDKTKHYFENDDIILIYEDYNEGEIEVKGVVFGFTESDIILKTKNGLENYLKEMDFDLTEYQEAKKIWKY